MLAKLKSTIMGLGLAAGAVVAAHAQSVSSLPPASETQGQTAATAPFGSTQGVYPKPGGSQVWSEDRSQPTYDYSASGADHPASTTPGPKTN